MALLERLKHRSSFPSNGFQVFLQGHRGHLQGTVDHHVDIHFRSRVFIAKPPFPVLVP